jgi:hypothetical protein
MATLNNYLINFLSLYKFVPKEVLVYILSEMWHKNSLYLI